MRSSALHSSPGDAVAIAVLSWSLAAVAVEPSRTTSPRWLAPHASDAHLAARLASFPATACAF